MRIFRNLNLPLATFKKGVVLAPQADGTLKTLINVKNLSIHDIPFNNKLFHPFSNFFYLIIVKTNIGSRFDSRAGIEIKWRIGGSKEEGHSN